MNIVNLIETNPITKFSGNYQSRLVGKLRYSSLKRNNRYSSPTFTVT